MISCIFVGFCVMLVVLVTWLLSADDQTLIDRCGVEVITPEDLTDKPQILTQLLASGALRKI